MINKWGKPKNEGGKPKIQNKINLMPKNQKQNETKSKIEKTQKSKTPTSEKPKNQQKTRVLFSRPKKPA